MRKYFYPLRYNTLQIIIYHFCKKISIYEEFNKYFYVMLRLRYARRRHLFRDTAKLKCSADSDNLLRGCIKKIGLPFFCFCVFQNLIRGYLYKCEPIWPVQPSRSTVLRSIHPPHIHTHPNTLTHTHPYTHTLLHTYTLLNTLTRQILYRYIDVNKLYVFYFI